jgi:CubicO group peptidase (beta-lactamase class C family)
MHPRKPKATTSALRLSAGECSQQFSLLRAVFDETLHDDPIRGAALAVYVDGELEVDLWGGKASETRNWARGTRAVVFSAGKAVAALGMLQLVDRGILSVNQPVAAYWPEFSASGKAEIRLADVLTHAAGLPWWDGMDRIVKFGRREGWGHARAITDGLARATPVVVPGTEIAYHALTYGWLLNEVAVRTTGHTLTRLVDENISRPLGLSFGYRTSGGDVASLAIRTLPPGARHTVVEAYRPSAPIARALAITDEHAICRVAEMANSRQFLDAAQPAITAVSDARSLAMLYSVLAGGEPHRRLLSMETTQDALAVHKSGHDMLTGDHRAFGWGVVHYRQSGFPTFPNTAIGHPGFGGTVAFGDPAARLGFAYIPGALELRPESEHERALCLVDACYKAIAGSTNAAETV